MNLYCIVPAAGESSRFPWNKMLYEYSEKPILAQTISNIVESGVFNRVIVVLGYQAHLAERVLREYRNYIDIVFNPNFRLGMSSSIKLGVEYVVERYPSVRVIGVNPGDAAWIHPGVYVNVAVRFLERLDEFYIAVATYKGRRGHPILFSTCILKDLFSISEEKMGLKEVTSKYADKTMLVETEYPGVVLDLDTILDLLRIKQLVYK